MGMYCGTFDHALLRGQVGPEVDQVDTYTLVRRADACAEADCARGGDAHCGGRARVAAARGRGGAPEARRRLYLALRDLARERHWDALTVKCQYELSQEYGIIACVPLSLLGDEGLPCGCEGDVLTSVTMLMLRYLSGGTVTYGDLLDLHEGVACSPPAAWRPSAWPSRGGAPSAISATPASPG